MSRALLITLFLSACGPSETPPMPSALGGECGADQPCAMLPCADGGRCFELMCRPEFAGGACMVYGCTGDLECPAGTACAMFPSGTYCARLCSESLDCNIDRSDSFPAQCDVSVDFIELHTEGGCVPPAS